jgi:mannose-1-phosphate guanylyltransferase
MRLFFDPSVPPMSDSCPSASLKTSTSHLASSSPLSSDDRSLYAVVLAGGHGERFWPLSRKAKPKHHLALFSERTLLESTLDRLQGLVDPERILVLTGIDQAEAVRTMLHDFPQQNILVEPERRDTAAAMALAAGAIARRDPEATVVVLPSDHHIPSTEELQHTLRSAVHVARKASTIVTIAIRPTWPCPAFGYLELGQPSPDLPLAHPVIRFHEKPSSEVAQTYLDRGNFQWNAGMFVWTVPTLRRALEETAPAIAEFCSQLMATSSLDSFLEERFRSVPKISFDYAVMEKLPDALAIEAAFEWDDLGGWTAAGRYLPKDASGNASNVPVQAAQAQGNIVFSGSPDQHVALLGVDNLIIVNTPDALLICPKDQAERLKELVGSLPSSLR